MLPINVVHVRVRHMHGVIKKLVEARGFGFISAAGEERDLFFHSNELTGVSFDELRAGDSVAFEVQEVSRKRAPRGFLQPYGEQKVVTSDSLEAIELQKKVDAEFIVRLSRDPQDLYHLNAK